jgi:predicted secreted Zn-dependent protease
VRAHLLVLVCGLALLACSQSAASRPLASEEPDLGIAAAEVPDGTSVPVELRETFRIDTYPVMGHSAAEIRADLNRSGPLSIADGRRFDALTSWSLQWSTRIDRSRGSCTLAEATLFLDIVVLLPELAEPNDVSPRTLATWKSYREALEGHEMGHVENQRQGATALQTRLNQMGGAWENCRDLSATLKAEGEAALQAIFAADRTYDEGTMHGRTQGAAFP